MCFGNVSDGRTIGIYRSCSRRLGRFHIFQLDGAQLGREIIGVDKASERPENDFDITNFPDRGKASP
jgi:hypothetical protein